MSGHVRLSVNVSHATARAFRELIGRKGITITEGVRRAIAVWRFVEAETAAGNRLAVITQAGTVHEVTLLDNDPPSHAAGRTA